MDSSVQIGREEKMCVKTFLVLSTTCLIIAILFFQQTPMVQRLLIFGKEYFESFSSNPGPFIGFWIFMTLHALTMGGFLLGIFSVSKKRIFDGWQLFVGLSGYLFMMLTYISRIYYIKKMAASYLASDAATQNIIEAYGILEFDWFNIAYGFPALWFLIFGIQHIFSKDYLIALFSFIISVSYLVSVYGYLGELRWVLTVTSSMAFLGFLVWAILMYRHLNRIRLEPAIQV